MADFAPEQRAGELLPCRCDPDRSWFAGEHDAACPANFRGDAAAAIRAAEERGRLAERLRIASGIGFMASEYEDAGRDDAAKAARGLDKWVRSLGDGSAIRAAGEEESGR